MEALKQISLLEAFRDDCINRGMTPESIRRYISSLRTFLAWLDERDIDVKHVDRFVLREFLSYLRSKGLKQKTLENYFSAISSFYDFLQYENVVNGNPVIPVRKRYLNPYKKNKNSERRVLTVKEASLLVNSIPYIRDKAIVLLLLKTGIRRGELISIDVQDIMVLSKTIYTKNNRPAAWAESESTKL